MIEYRTGDILQADAEALVNTVNCVGVMGRGVALQFKNAFPANFKAYEEACRRGEVQPGRMFVHPTGGLTNPKFIINFPTKRHWRGKSQMRDIDAGLQALVSELRTRRIASVAVPPLGSGLGGLVWEDVRRRIEDELGGLTDLHVIVFEPRVEKSGLSGSVSRDVPQISAGRAALVVLINRYLGGLLDPFVTLLEVHKLMYFMQQAGEPLRLRYVAGHYGPYAENLRNVLAQIEGHLVSGYADGGDQPGKQLELIPGAVDDAEAFLSGGAEATRQRLERVAALVDGFETPFGLELLATVHWVSAHEGITSPGDVVRRIHGWNERKKRFSARQIEMAMNVLRDKGWLLATKVADEA